MAVDKDVGLLAKTGLVGFAFLVLAATWLTSAHGFERARPVSSLLKPSVLASVFLAAFAGFTAISELADLMSPRPAVERSPGHIQQTGDDTNTRVRALQAALNKTAPIEHAVDQIAGAWGETSACRVTYTFTFADGGLSIKRNAAGLPAFSVVARIKALRPTGVTVAIVSDGPERGQSLDLDIVRAGPIETLTWNEEATDASLELHRCSPQR